MSRRTAVIALDILTAALLLLTAVIVYGGGFVIRASAVRLSFRSPDRALIALSALVALRLFVDRRSEPFALTTAQRRRFLFRDGGDPLQVGPAPGSRRRTVLASLGIGCLLAAMLHDQVLHLYSVPDLGDPLFSMWRMGWVSKQLVSDASYLFDANIFYPDPLTLTFSDPMILVAVMSWPLRALGVPHAVAYNVTLLAGFWLSGIATYVLVARLTGSALGGFVAGLTYACAAFRFDHYSHLELQMTQWIPLALLALHLFIATTRWPYAVALAAAGLAQLYSSMYYAVFLLTYAFAIGAGLILAYRQAVRALIVPGALAAAIAAVGVVPLAEAFIAADPLKGERTITEVRYFSAQPSDYLRANTRSAVWKDRTQRAPLERALFPGVAPVLLAAIGVAPPFSATRLVYLAALLVAYDASLGMNGAIYPWLREWLPPVRGLRAPARFVALVALSLSVLAGFGARRIVQRCRSTAAAVGACALVTAVIVVDAWPSLTLVPVWKSPPPIYEPLEGSPGAILAEFPVLEDMASNLPYMYFSLWHWTPMVNGYSGFIPRSYAGISAELQRFPHGNSIDALRRRGVSHVTVNCGLEYEGCEETAARMRESKDLRLVVDQTWQGRGAQLYELRR